ncbi:MAG: hypothetical protein EH225_01975 [Calditrichaeota bacterium]|nr:tetratricopeptide repeat protein [Calditrichota bacterium]RQW07404.1 MAG: hypothetical protein EH225_01975 [Calditrichota bacterium]
MPLTARQKELIQKKYEYVSARKLAKELDADSSLIEEYIKGLKDECSQRQQKVFRLLLILTPVFFFVLLEMALRVFGYGENLALFVNAPEGYEKYRMINQRVSQRFFPGRKNTPTPPFDLFLKEKPENGYRIFVLGGSTAAGYPYGNNLMFPRIVQFYLNQHFPQKKSEVVNVAMAAINSYALLDFMDEILREKPDLILFYAGHNEYYGALGVASSESIGRYRWIVKSYLYLDNYKTFILLRDLLKGITRIFPQNGEEVPTATLMERLVAQRQIPFHGDLYEQGKFQFQENLRDLLRKAYQADVPVLVSELVSNVRDQRPFISVPAGKYPPAETVYQKALQLLEDGRTKEARQNFYLAKDLDALRFRAAEELNEIIYSIAGEFNFPVVPMIQFFESVSVDNLIGNDMMLEHLHPNINGYFMMVRAFIETMKKFKFIDAQEPGDNGEDWQFLKQSWGYTPLDSLYGRLRIHILKGGWPFQPKAAPNKALLNYQPGSLEDSMAVRIWRDSNYSLERAHVELADYYDKRKRFHEAFLEYRALIALTPFNVSPYLRAADMLLKNQKMEKALGYLEKSLQLEETMFALKWIGQIYLLQERTEEAIPFLEKARRVAPSDPQLLFNLAGAYALAGRYESSHIILQQLLKISPDFPDAVMLYEQVESILKGRSSG